MDNQGTLTVNQALTVGRASATQTNSGTIAVSGGDLTITQSGTTPSVTSTGTITVSAGQTLTVSGGGTFTHQTGATLSGAGTVAVSGATSATFNGSVTLSGLTLTNVPAAAVTGSFTVGAHTVVNSTVNYGATPLTTAGSTFTLTNATVNGTGGLTNAGGQTLFMTSTTINMPVANQGLLIAEGTSAITGALTTTAGAILRVEGNGFCCNTQLTVASGFTNNGAIELTSLNGAISATLAVTAGTLLNPAGSTITALAGTGGARTLAAQVDNQGTLDLFPSAAGTLTINGSLTSSGIINMELGGTTAGSTYDVLNVTSGPATISGGTLNVTLINGFTPSNGQNFTILTSSAPRSGTFATANRPANTSMQYNPNSVVVTAP